MWEARSHPQLAEQSRAEAEISRPKVMLEPGQDQSRAEPSPSPHPWGAEAPRCRGRVLLQRDGL